MHDNYSDHPHIFTSFSKINQSEAAVRTQILDWEDREGQERETGREVPPSTDSLILFHYSNTGLFSSNPLYLMQFCSHVFTRFLTGFLIKW